MNQQQWEYLTRAVPQQSVQQCLDVDGPDGWELTAVVPAMVLVPGASRINRASGILEVAEPDKNVMGAMLIFKRPKATEAEANCGEMMAACQE